MALRRKKILFIAEAVTLAHVARPAVLARSLDPNRYEVVFASAERYLPLLRDLNVPLRPIYSISEQHFLESLSKGAPLHNLPTLRAYVEEDLAVLKETAPDMVVGDLRHSLAVSARIAKIPYATIVNAYWSPYAAQRYTVPDVPAVRLLGVPVANFLFQFVRESAFAAHCKPLNAVKREHGMPCAERDIRRMYTDADYVLYPETPELVPTTNLPANHSYLGPILWTPTVELPDWWDSIRRDRPILYVTLGSSGRPELLERTLKALAEEPVTVLAATVNAPIRSLPANVLAANFLPGLDAAALADLVICNGGSPTAHQAISAGTPVLGLPGNMDQHLNMSFLAATGAGAIVRSDQASAARLRETTVRMLGAQSYRENVLRLRDSFRQYDALERFQRLIENFPI